MIQDEAASQHHLVVSLWGQWSNGHWVQIHRSFNSIFIQLNGESPPLQLPNIRTNFTIANLFITYIKPRHSSSISFNCYGCNPIIIHIQQYILPISYSPNPDPPACQHFHPSFQCSYHGVRSILQLVNLATNQFGN